MKGKNSINLVKVLIITFSIAAIISLGSIIVKASDNSHKKEEYRYYTSITIEDSDTLWSIEDKYNNGNEDKNTYINNIIQLNNMNSDVIKKGSNILVYYYSDQIK
ncbi:MAG: LysM peptidoglycan-binding domain-containing protein [Eubacteriales bacterium]|nr:LysM peptidoglycan-binding domain-containing protein [Eubacteriales bacterium]